jgi:hypothetical protein
LFGGASMHGVGGQGRGYLPRAGSLSKSANVIVIAIVILS